MEGLSQSSGSQVLTIASANINSFNNSVPDVTKLFNEQKLDILFLQETHRVDLSKIKPYLNLCDLALFPNAPSVEQANHHFKSGTAILLRNTTNAYLQTSTQTILPNRAQFLKFTVGSATYLIVNIYMPSGKSNRRRKQRSQLLELLEERIQEEAYDFLLLIGDFNMVLRQIDATAPLVKSDDFYTTQNFLRRNNLIDSFRCLNPQSKSFTYIRHNTASRLDRIYLPAVLQHKLIEATHFPLTFSDHNFAPLIRLQFDTMIQIPTTPLWKLNDYLLLQNTNQARFDVLLEKGLTKPMRFEDPIRWWDDFKLQTKQLFQEIGSFHSQIFKNRKPMLHQQLKTASPEQVPILLEKLRQVHKHEENGAFIRSRSKIPDDTETPTKRFFQSEKNQQQKTLISALQTRDNAPATTNPLEIKEHITQHFKARWNDPSQTAPQNFEEYLSDVPALPQQHDDTPHLITQDEIKLAINDLTPNTSPGSDGLTPKFYKTFQQQLTPILHQLYNNMYLRNCAHASHKTGIIKLIPKSGKSTNISNWRPISLLNCDYKILTKILANRLTSILSEYISATQQAAIKGRHLHNVLLNIKSAIDYSNDIKHPLALLQIDFSKAFDKVSHSFILAVMKHINLPTDLVKWTAIILHDTHAQVLVNRSLTERIPISTGIRQGCPLSMLLFALATDVLAKKFLASPHIHGVSLEKTTLKLQQYADDTTLLLSNKQEVGPALQVINTFSQFSNLKLNSKKTTLMSNCNVLANEIRKQLPDTKRVNEAKLLGIYFSLTGASDKKNWSNTTAVLKSIADAHRSRNLTMFGKLNLIKTLLLPHITLMSRIFICPVSTQKLITKILHKFLWAPLKLEPVSRSILSKTPQHGGIGMPCVTSWSNAAFASRIKVLMSDHQPDFFWTTYGLYNLSYHCRTWRPGLFSNCRPHRPEPNKDWKQLLSLFRQCAVPVDQWQEITHKQLYHTFLNSTPCELPKLNGRLQPCSWSEILLLSKNYKCLSDKQKEIIYKVAHSGFFFGRFNVTHNIRDLSNGGKRINSCKFCSSPNDVTRHVFYECPISRRILFKLQDCLRQKTQTQVILTKSTVLYNVCQQPERLKPLILKSIATYREIILEEKLRYDASNQLLKKTESFINATCQSILARTQAVFHD